MIRHSLSSIGSYGSVPQLQRYYGVIRHADTLSASPRCPLARQYPSHTRFSFRWMAACGPSSARRHCSRGAPHPRRCFRLEMSALPRFPGCPSALALLLDPDRTRPFSPLANDPVLLAGYSNPSAPIFGNFGARSHSSCLSLSTLRSQDHPFPTQDSLVARWLGVRHAGLSPAGHRSKVYGSHWFSSPLPELGLAQ